MENGTILKAIIVVVALAVVAIGGSKILTGLATDGVSDSAQTSSSVSGNVREIYVKAFRWGYDPSTIVVKKGERVRIIAESLDVPHGFAIDEYGISLYLDGVRKQTVEFVADKTGTFTIYCNVPCGSGHPTMRGRLIVEE